MMYLLSGKRSVRRAEPQAFTLIELLVVVAIIALLVAILLPSLSAARAEAERIVCASNLKQFAYAFVYYCNDNGGQFPESSDWGDEEWFVQFVKYIGEDRRDIQDVFDCPADEDKEVNSLGYNMPFANFHALTMRLGEFYPAWGYPWPVARLPHNINDVRRPSDVMSFTETWGTGFWPLTPYGPIPFATWVLDMDFDGDGVLDSNTTEYDLGMERTGFYHPYNRVGARHPGRVCNIGFVDSHVESQFINDMLYDRVLWAVELVGLPDKEPP